MNTLHQVASNRATYWDSDTTNTRVDFYSYKISRLDDVYDTGYNSRRHALGMHIWMDPKGLITQPAYHLKFSSYTPHASHVWSLAQKTCENLVVLSPATF